MLVVYVKLWKIDGQKQRHIAGKSFKVRDVEGITTVLDWVANTLGEVLEREGE